ncbi:NAD(P)/FAD-dependent oxidoreductase [Mangrovicoccus algicola]|uniref:FAD-binding oxidoreductase n=1 Tax=Mangrovicoccus algicola TaxID=2771008 RepID=A0A8J6ZDT9_9RHOB|nr:FAD-dependent oxidoreductase [Mangrovicoccus algicola]MBE3640091.1 FAD-binding oxidoreductase [Mangrovicoccus algicola]
MSGIDVTIRGAGIFGLSIAYACAARGARVRVIDPGGIGAGSSGGIVGALAPHVPERWNPKKAFQFESLRMAPEFWAGVARTGGRDPGYLRSGRLQPLADAAAVELARLRAAEAATLWQGFAAWRVVEAAAHAGWAPPSPTGLLIEDTLTARLHPRMAGQALAAAVTALGGEIAGSGPETGALVLATGWRGLLDLNAELGQPAGAGIKGQAALFRAGACALPQIFAGGLHVVPHADGTVAVGSTSERDFAAPDTTDAQCDALIAAARALCPLLEGAPVIERWAGVRPRARSRAPMLGRHPGRDGVFIANGGFKIGFGMAPLVAEVMADLVLDGRDRIPEGFRVADSLKG